MTRRRPTGLAAIGIVVALVIGVWLLNGRDPGTSTDPGNGEQSYSGSRDGGGRLPSVDLDDLPPEAADTVDLIDDSGPFPEDEDGSTFQNREGILPDEPRGYYHEYTVPTPGSDDRGARRIVAGGDVLYWTQDHYGSFAVIER